MRCLRVVALSPTSSSLDSPVVFRIVPPPGNLRPARKQQQQETRARSLEKPQRWRRRGGRRWTWGPTASPSSPSATRPSTRSPLMEFTDSGSDNRDATLSECAQKDIAGDALLFFNLSLDGTADSLSLHAGCPVIKGEKWSATKWIRVASFDKVYHAQGNCTDDNESCAKCTALGECTKNPEYMVGTAALPGYCRRPCNVC